MFEELKINGTMLPRPDDVLDLKNEKKKTEYETEAGTTQVSVSRVSKLTLSGNWTVTGAWLKKFRAWSDADTVTVSCFYPEVDHLSDHECQLSVDSEKHIKGARDQLHTDGLYQISVTMEEL